MPSATYNSASAPVSKFSWCRPGVTSRATAGRGRAARCPRRPGISGVMAGGQAEGSGRSWNPSCAPIHPAAATTGSTRTATCSPVCNRSRIRPANQCSHPSRSGPPSPGRQRRGANLTLIADLLAKQRCKSAMLRTQDVGNQRLRPCRHPEGAVSAREAQQEPGRVEVALGGETEQTAGPAAAGLSRDDQQGMAEPIDQSANMWRSSDSALAPISRPLRGSWSGTCRSVEVRAARDGP